MGPGTPPRPPLGASVVGRSARHDVAARGRPPVRGGPRPPPRGSAADREGPPRVCDPRQPSVPQSRPGGHLGRPTAIPRAAGHGVLHLLRAGRAAAGPTAGSSGPHVGGAHLARPTRGRHVPPGAAVQCVAHARPWPTERKAGPPRRSRRGLRLRRRSLGPCRPRAQTVRRRGAGGTGPAQRRAKILMPEKKERKKTTRRKKKQAVAESRGLSAKQLVAAPPPALQKLQETIEADGGTVLGAYRDPLGGNWQLLAGLPLAKVEPTPYQRDLSETHVAKLAKAIDKLDRYLDPLVVVRSDDGTYWTPNGYHRLGALRLLGAKAIVAIVVPDHAVAHRILVLNTEKAHNVRERALEVTRLEHGLAELDDRPEKEFETEFEEPALLTLGLCYQQNGRFSGGVYQPILKRIDEFLSAKLSKALEIRRERAKRVVELDDAVSAAVGGLKARGFQSPYLKAFVVARINFLRFKKGKAEFDDTLEKLIAAAKKFDIGKVKPDQVATAGGPPEE